MFKKINYVVVLLVSVLLVCSVFSVIVGAVNFKKGDYVIALSNSYYGNNWRKQMVNAFEDVAEMAKEKGYIKDYLVVNGDGTQNQQISQMNSLILKGVDVIVVDSASPTALNGAIKNAVQAGIEVLSFDSIATSPYCYKLNFNFKNHGREVVKYVAERLNGKGNVVQVRGISGSAPAIDMYKGQMDMLKNYPDIHVAASVVGKANAAVTQQAINNILASLPSIDGVLTQAGNDAYGAVKAFENSDRPMPLIPGDNSAEFIHWWAKAKKENGYKTMSIGSSPVISRAAFWLALSVLNDVDLPKDEVMMFPLTKVNQDEVEKYSDIKPGNFVSPKITYDYVEENIINCYQK